MAHADLRHGFGLGPVIINDVDAYTKGRTCTLVDPGGGGDPYLEFASSWTGENSEVNILTFSLDYRFWVFSIYFDGTSPGDISLLRLKGTNPLFVKLFEVDSTNFNLGLRLFSVDYQGSTSLATGAWHTFLVEFHAPDNDMRLFLWSGSAWDEEVVVRGGGNVIAPVGWWSWQNYSGIGANKIRYKLCDASESDNRDAAPDGNVAAVVSHPNGDGTYDGYGDHANCGVGQVTGTYAHWDDWASGTADDATTYNCEIAGEAGAITSDFPSTTVPSGFYGITVRAIARPNIDDKTVANSFRITDGTNDIDRTNHGLVDKDIWDLRIGGFSRAPDGAAWTQTKWNGAEVGIVSDSGNGANDQWTALAVELMGVGNSTLPEIVATGAAASGVAFGSANVGIY